MFSFARQSREERGSVSVEATIALTAFLFMFLILFSIITVCRAQAKIQVALNSTAKEISQYCYLYGISGLDQSISKFQQGTAGTEDSINNLTSGVVGVFEGITSLGDSAKTISTDVTSVMDQWGTLVEQADGVKDSANAASKELEKIAEDPTGMLIGMGKLAASKGWELAKSRAIATPITRALIKKHLMRNSSDTPDAFLASLYVQPDTYMGEMSYFNGLDFSNSTLFPNGASDEINLVVSYKVKLLELLPVDVEYSITQSAITLGWLHGDAEGTSSTVTLSDTSANLKKEGTSIWSEYTASKRDQDIISDQVNSLVSSGCKKSAENVVKAYDPASNTAYLVSSTNPLYGVKSLDEIDKETLKKDIERRYAQLNAAGHNRVTLNIKEKDANGNMTRSEISCPDVTMKYVLVVPEDEGLQEYVQQVITDMGYADSFEVKKGYGSYLVDETTQTEGETTPAEGA